MGTIQTTVFVQSLSNFTCKLWIIRGGIYWFRLAGSKVKVSFSILYIKPCGHDTDYSFCPLTFKLNMQVVDDERKNTIDLGLWGPRSTVTLCIKPCRHDTDYSFCPITFKLHMHIVDDKRRNPFDFELSGQRSTLGLCLWNLVWFRIQFLSDHFQTSYTCKLLLMRGETLFIMGHRVYCPIVVVNFAPPPPPCEGMPRFGLFSFSEPGRMSGELMS